MKLSHLKKVSYTLPLAALLTSFFFLACEGTESSSPLSDAEAVSADAESIVIEYSGNDSPDHVTEDITLPASGTNGSLISWSSGNSQIIGDDGTVNRPAADVSIVLTATVTKNSVSTTAIFELTAAGFFEEGESAAASDLSFASVTRNSTSVEFEWNDPGLPDLQKYYLSYTNSGDPVYEKIGFTETGYTFTGLSTETEYTFVIQGADSSNAILFRYLITLSTTDTPVSYTAVNNQSELSSISLDQNYMLMFDISLSGEWTPIGDDTLSYSGSFHGGGHTVSNLYIDTTESYQGLFGYSSGIIESVGILDADITAYKYAGALTGYDTGIIKNSYSTGTVSHSDTSTSYDSYTGGLAGLTTGEIYKSYSTADVSGSSVVGGLAGRAEGSVTLSKATGTISGEDEVGGLVGMLVGATVSTSFATGDISSTGSNSGALVGRTVSYSEISDSYARGNISGDIIIGGITGRLYVSTITRSYSTSEIDYTGVSTSIGGVAGFNTTYSTISYSYFNSDMFSGNTVGTTDDSTETESYGRSAAQMTDPLLYATYYAGWDFTDTWAIDPDINDGYPYLIENMPD
jgi:hypothetical protein